MPPLIHVVADYGAGDLAFAEVLQRLELELPGALVVCTPVPPFDTISCGFCVAQLALTDGPIDRVVLHNVAPRRDSPSPREGNAGEPFVVCELPDDVLVVGPNAGHALSFVAPEALSMRFLDAPTAGSQFRSRDFVPAALARLRGGDRGALGEAVPPGAVPPAPARAVVYVDGYGNLKTSWHDAPAEPGERVVVRIGQHYATAVVSDGTFAVAEGELAFAPGSSGWTGRRGRRRFYELLLRGGSAAKRFGKPVAGTPVHVEPVDALRDGSRAAAGSNGPDASATGG
ncbi:MAG: hypothetical protein ACXVFK_18910 [Solirubrobacteraceae bacterium]